MNRKLRCICPRTGMLAIEQGRHKYDCPARRASWTLAERLRYWIGQKIPASAVTPYEGDDSQRPMTADEHSREMMDSLIPDGFTSHDHTPKIVVPAKTPKSRHQRFQDRVAQEASQYSWGDPPPWRHLGKRIPTTIAANAVRLRRWLVWLAPFIGVGYVAFAIVRGG